MGHSAVRKWCWISEGWWVCCCLLPPDLTELDPNPGTIYF